MKIEPSEILRLLKLPHVAKSGNFICPFCQHQSLKPYKNNQLHCHTQSCQWHGDAIDLYSGVKSVSRNEAFAELSKSFSQIKLTPITQSQALNNMAKDLEFLSWVRMYFAYYGNDRENQQFYANKYNTTKKTFSLIINGEFDKISPITWHKITNSLRIDININEFKKDIKKGKSKFKDDIIQNNLKSYIKKYTLI